MSTLGRAILGVTMSSAAIVSIVACSDDSSAPRASFESADAAADVMPPDLPKAGDPDASVATDAAADARAPFDPADEPVDCGDAGAGACAKEIVAGSNHFCVRLDDGTVRCWGEDTYGARGGDLEAPPKGSDAGITTHTVLVSNVSGATQLSASRWTTCARIDDGSVRCWGSNSFGQLGLDGDKPSWDEFPHPTASSVALKDPAKRVDVGPENACATLANGKVWCWGTNRLAQLARADAPLDYVMVPGEASLGGYAVATTAVGSGTMFGVTASGDVVSWGAVAGGEGFLGGRMTSISPDPAPNAIPLLHGVNAIVASATLYKDEAGPLAGAKSFGPFPPPPTQRHAHACALVKGEVYCWGKTDTSALCTGLPDSELWPAPAPTSGKAWPQRLAVGDEITCARMTDGTVQCCGGDAYGRLGTGMTDPVAPFFRPVASFTGHAVQVATSNRAVCALLRDGTVQCWGSNAHGELALDATDEDSHPTPVKVTFR